MPPIITGIHHVTAFARDPSANIRFYTDILGLRFIKQTVNYDDPSVYHLYYADRIGTPGTVLTFFPNPHMGRGRHASDEIATTTFAIPHASLPFWRDRLAAHDIPTTTDDDAPRLHFEDHDTLPLSLIESDPPAHTPFNTPDIPAEHAITGFHSTTIRVRDHNTTAEFLTRHLGFTPQSNAPNRTWLTLQEGLASQRIELIHDPAADSARFGAGIVHHVAWRVPDESSQLRIREDLLAAGVPVTQVLDRNYFKSIYFRIPPGLVFEIATDGPGFTIDEPIDALGTSLKLPPHLEPHRTKLESQLPPLSRD